MIALLIERNFYGKFPAVDSEKCAIEIFIQEIKFLIEYLVLNLNKARELFPYKKRIFLYAVGYVPCVVRNKDFETRANIIHSRHI